MLELARQHIGGEYENVLVPKNNPNWRGPWDCAEFMSWIVFQDAGILYGCINDSANPAVADAYTGAWRKDSASRGIRIPIQQAAAIVGSIVLRFPPEPGRMGHIAICDGEGGTVEAKGHAFGFPQIFLSMSKSRDGVSLDTAGFWGGITAGLRAMLPLMLKGVR
jgi:hypothetical protein